MPVPAPDYELGQFFDLSPDLLCIAGFDGYFKRLNRSFERVMGYSSEELMSRPFLEFVHPNDVERAREALIPLANGQDRAGFEGRLVCVDGAVRRFEWNTRTLPNEGVLYGISRDVAVRSGLAEEQVALRRMATMVAEAAPPGEIFSAVSNEVAAIFHTELVVVGKFDGDPAELLVVGVGDGADEPVVGSRWKLDDALASAAVYRTGLPARHDHPRGGADLDVAAIVERIRPVGTVAVPVKVEGRLWGAMIISTLSELLPADTAERLQSFTDLIATALANAAARGEVERLAEEQAALRRVAVLVAQQPSPGEVFTAVTRAVGLLLNADLAGLHVFSGDGTATTIASWSGDGPMLPIGTRFPLDGDSLAARIFETGAPARIDSYAEAEGETAVRARTLRVRSAVGAPILVEGKLWGALMAATRGVEPWAENAETRIAAFTELVATAVANAESREALAELADEQAALRRVATMVARGLPASELFGAVAREVGALLGTDFAGIGRFEADAVISVASSNEGMLPTGTRWEIDDVSASAQVYRTGSSARVDGMDWSRVRGPLSAASARLGVVSTVASPIIVDGRTWGAVSVSSTHEALPPDTEARLASFTELVATAIANAESSAEITASRRRIVAASDDARRRIVRDLHDGAQQRLVHTVITLKLAQRALANGAENGPLLVQEAIGNAEQAMAEVRELAHGILPSVLTRGGLRAGVRALTSRMPVPVEVAIPAERLPAPIEATAYFIVAEALTNVAKHARATSAAVAAQVENGSLRVEVRDDGVGGARPDGSGLQGLRDRLAALDGRLRIESPADGGTLVAATIPIPASATER